MKKEFLTMVVIGFLILGYVLDAVVNPLALNLPTPYHYFTLANLSKYPFTSVSIILKALSLVVSPLLLLASFGIKRFFKGAILLVISGLLQLYALQDVATNARVLPLEWSISLTLTGLLLLIPTILYLLMGFIQLIHHNIINPYGESEEESKD